MVAHRQSSGGSQPQTGDGSPAAGMVIPTAIGGLYIDTTNGGLYIAVGLTAGDWVGVGGYAPNNTPDVPGVMGSSSSTTVLVSSGGAGLSDVQGFNNSGNGIYWSTGEGDDGDQYLTIYVGGKHFRFNDDGTFDASPSKGIIFPIADPHIAGAWWNNLGTLTMSAG